MSFKLDQQQEDQHESGESRWSKSLIQFLLRQKEEAQSTDTCQNSVDLNTHSDGHYGNGRHDLHSHHGWNCDETSYNSCVSPDGRCFNRMSVAFSTDAVRGEIGFDTSSSASNSSSSSSIHVWKISWPVDQRGSHACLGISTKDSLLSAAGYVSLLGSDCHSWGWDISNRILLHDSIVVNSNYPSDFNLAIPEDIYCILDMHKGHMSFLIDDTYLGIAFRDLNTVSKTLYPSVCSVWGESCIRYEFIGSIRCEPKSLMNECKSVIRRSIGRDTLRDDVLMKRSSFKQLIPSSLFNFIISTD